jgi:hypothetical protein
MLLEALGAGLAGEVALGGSGAAARSSRDQASSACKTAVFRKGR